MVRLQEKIQVIAKQVRNPDGKCGQNPATQDSWDEKWVTFKFRYDKKTSENNYEEKDIMKSDIRQSEV